MSTHDPAPESRNEWPRISIVVPSFNQGRYIQDTLDSIISQRYPHKEIIVMDGGSTDETVGILERYSSHIAHWESKPDGGQTPALIKGFRHSTGEVLCWLNSDDLFNGNVLEEVAQYFRSRPNVGAVFGDTIWIGADGRELRRQREIPFNRFIWLYTYNYIPGMSMFWRRHVYFEAGELNPEFNLAMDADLWDRMATITTIAHRRAYWSKMRYYPAQKNVRLRVRSDEEDLRIRRRHWNRDFPVAYPAKRLAARSLRVLWRLVTGCYHPGYKRELGDY